MSRPALNLARRPFVNRRPVRRVALLLGGLALLVGLLDLGLYGRDALDARPLQRRIAEARQELAAEQQRVQSLSQRPEFQRLEEYNAGVAQFNRLIDQRTFPWGRLFDRLSELMPAGVRLQRVAPAREDSSSARAVGERRVPLTVDGVARSDEVLYEFVDALFAAPDFIDAVLEQETQDSEGRSFSLSVRYRIPRTPAPEGETS